MFSSYFTYLSVMRHTYSSITHAKAWYYNLGTESLVNNFFSFSFSFNEAYQLLKIFLIPCIFSLCQVFTIGNIQNVLCYDFPSQFTH